MVDEDLLSDNETRGGDEDALTTERKKIARMGAEPFPAAKLRDIAFQPWHYGIDDIAKALHWSWNQMHAARKIARQLLRQQTGHVAREDLVITKKKIAYQTSGDLLQAWQERRTTNTCPNCQKLCIYSDFADSFQDLRTRIIILGDGTPIEDRAANKRSTCTDPVDTSRQVPCLTKDQKVDIVRAIVHHEMHTMKTIVEARFAETEDEVIWKFRWYGPEEAIDETLPTRGQNTRKAKHISPGDRKIGIYLGDAKNPDITGVVFAVRDLLPKAVNKYPQADGFPYDACEDKRLWEQVKRLDMPEDAKSQPQEKGWLRYQCKDKAEDGDDLRAVIKKWNVTDVKQLMWLLQAYEKRHAKEFKDRKHVPPFRVDYFRGSCGETSLETYE